MASRELSILTRVQGATQAVRDIGKISTAIDTVSTKVGGLRGKLGGIGSKVGGFLSATGIGDQISMMAIDASARAVRDTYDQVQAQTAAATKEVTSTGRDFLKSNPTVQELNTSIAGIEKGMEDMKANPLTYFVGGGDAMKELVKLREEYAKQRDAIMAEGAQTESLLRANLNKAQPTPIVNVSVGSYVYVTESGVRVQYTSTAQAATGAATPTYTYNPNTTG